MTLCTEAARGIIISGVIHGSTEDVVLTFEASGDRTPEYIISQ